MPNETLKVEQLNVKKKFRKIGGWTEINTQSRDVISETGISKNDKID